MKVGEYKQRKTRSDIKKGVKPTISLDLKDAIYRLHYITTTPVKDVCEYICHDLVTDRKTIDTLSKYFQREMIYDGSMFRGHLDNPHIATKINGPSSRITLTLKRLDYEVIYKLSFALDCSVSRAVAVLLEMGIKDINVVNQYIKDSLKKELTHNQMDSMKHLIEYMNDSNFDHESWASFLGYVYNNHGSPFLKMREIIADFLNDKK